MASLASATAAFVDEDYAAAEAHYTTALAEKPEDAAEIYAGRSASRLKLEDFVGAADDARKAVAAAPGLAKAHMRRGCAFSCCCCCESEENRSREGEREEEGASER